MLTNACSESNKQKPNLRAEHIINGSEPDKKYCDRIQVLAAINKIKHTVKKGEYDLKNMRETYKFLDEVITVIRFNIILFSDVISMKTYVVLLHILWVVIITKRSHDIKYRM